MIEINKLTKQFGNVKAVDCLSITFNQGINGLVGENGAGKSTLLRLIADVYDEDSGFIKIDGKDHTDLKAKELVFSFLALSISKVMSSSGSIETFSKRMISKRLLSISSSISSVVTTLQTEPSFLKETTSTPSFF